jgi:succinyl-diaminopimelate desuccinylase
MPVTQNHLDSMVDLLGALVSLPSRAGEDSPTPMLQAISSWLRAHDIPHQMLQDSVGSPVGLYGEIKGARPGPAYLLDATVDTALYGDSHAWHHPPDRATIANGWMYGRGSADSKAGISVFCHVLADLLSRARELSGSLCFVFDAEEHSGSFAGFRSYLDVRGAAPLAGVMIGYPGNDRLVTGGRGFLRSRLMVHGISAHSGSSSSRGVNAIDRARRLLEKIANEPLPVADEDFPLPPRITATAIRGGGSFSLVPDRCELELDIRLTPAFDEPNASRIIEAAAADLDSDNRIPPTTIEWFPGWPAYRIDSENPMVQVLAHSASRAFGHEIPLAVAGPSNIGNFLATRGIPATAGLGVTYRNVHAPDECVLLESLAPTFIAYRNAVIRLLGADSTA